LEISRKRCIAAQKFQKDDDDDERMPPLVASCLEILSFKRWGEKIKYF